jgi:hypothetical protein
MATIVERGRCPVCRTILSSERSEPIVVRQCPRCEACLWEVAFPSGTAFFVRRPGQSTAEFLAVLAGPRLGVSERSIAAFLRGADSLDMVEFMQELEAVLELTGGSRAR